MGNFTSLYTYLPCSYDNVYSYKFWVIFLVVEGRKQSCKPTPPSLPSPYSGINVVVVFR